MIFLNRCLKSIPVLFLLSIIIFILPRLTEGDPAILLAGEFADEEQLQHLRESMGLHLPLWQQYYLWMQQVIQGDFGVSLIYQKPVIDIIGFRLGPTFALTCYTLLISVSLGIPLGIYCAKHPNTWFDTLVSMTSTFIFSIPIFISGMLASFILGYWFALFPTHGYISIVENWRQHLYLFCLPVLSLSLLYSPLIIRITRTTLLEQLQMPYITTLRAKGVRMNRIILLHALKNSAIPILNVLGFITVLLLAGVVVTESLFEIPGLGSLIFEAILQRDFPVIQTITFLSAISYTILFLLLDSLYTRLDPRIRD